MILSPFSYADLLFLSSFVKYLSLAFLGDEWMYFLLLNRRSLFRSLFRIRLFRQLRLPSLFSQSEACYCFFNGVFGWAGIFYFEETYFVLIFFYSYCVLWPVRNLCLDHRDTVFSSWSFMVWAFTFGSVIHLELILRMLWGRAWG